MNDKISLIARKILAGGRNLVFTGAGISTESGISDYRSKGGIWDKFRPVYFDEFMPQYAKDSNAFLAIVNLSETPYDAVCDVLIKAKAGAVLPEIVNSVKRLQAAIKP